MDIQDLELSGIVAFDGLTKNSLQLHKDQKHFIYPMGNKVTIKHIETGSQCFLSGHTNLISTICVSPCGNYIASGQINHIGFKASVIIWDYHQRKIKGSHTIHKVRVEDVCFSCESNFLISLGGRDDGNVVIWDVKKNDALCGACASTDITGDAFLIRQLNFRDQYFLTSGDRTFKIWRIDQETRKVYGVDVKVGKLRRSVNCIAIDNRDELAYCGTSSGDIIKVRLNCYQNLENKEPFQMPLMIGCYSKVSKNPRNRAIGVGDLYTGGVTNLILYKYDNIIIGTGDGTLEMAKIIDSNMKVNKKMKIPSTPQIQTLLSENVRSGVTSLVVWKDEFIIVGTIFSEIYQIRASNFDMRLLVTCHTASIYDITFPHNYSEIFATSSKNDIRLWRLETQRELLRITVPNIVCSSIYFSYDGRMLVSAWNDGVIRAFTPQTGRLIFTILNAHIKAISAITLTNDGNKIISGGLDGQIRIWKIEPEKQKLIYILKEHRGSITSLHINNANTEVISSSVDGTCVIWDIQRGSRKQILMGNTMYMAARFSPNSIQILTCGTDRKITYWEVLDGSMIRELEGSSSGALNCIDISPDGKYFVTGGNDSNVKFWSYDIGETTHIGMGHAAIITACKISPDGKHIVTVSADGAIMIWKCPFETKFIEEEVESTISSRSTCSLREENMKNRLALDVRNKNVTDLTPRPDTQESIKAVHKNDEPCKCDANSKASICRCCNDDEKSQILETTRSSKSSSSQKSKKSEVCKKSKSTESIRKYPTPKPLV